MGSSSAEKKEGGGVMERVKEFVEEVGQKLEGVLGFGRPTAKVASVRVAGLSVERAEMVVDVLLSNPNPIPIPLLDMRYLIESDGRKLLSGLIPDAGTLHAHGSETLKIPVTLIYKDIHDTYDDISPGSIIPYRLKLDLIADVPILGKLTIPLEKSGEIPIPHKPDVEVEKIQFEHLSLDQTNAILHLKVDNRNQFDLGVSALEYQLSLADVPVSSANLSSSTTIGKCGQGTVLLPFSFRPKSFGSAMWDIVRGKGAGYSLAGKLNVDTPFGPMTLPFSKQGAKTKLQKKHGNGKEDSDEEV